MTIQSVLDGIEQTLVDEEKLSTFTTERQHYGVAFDLFREEAAYVCVLANTTVGDRPGWDVRQAVLGGHLVRMFKLMCFVMEESIEHRDELMSILIRLLAECVINLRYLIREVSDDLIQSYLASSLQHERDLAELVRKNIYERGGESLPIEDRMLLSIDRTFHKSGISEADLPKKKIRNWGDKNLYEKAQAIGLSGAYIAIFGGPSRNVHGGWQDLLQYHLECEPTGLFRPKIEFSRPRPQAVYALTHLISETLLEYIEMLSHPAVEPVKQRIEDVIHRNHSATTMHEQYLVRKNG